MSKQSPIEKLLELGLLDPKLFDVEPLPIVDGEFVCAFGGCWFGFYCVEHQLAATVSLVMLIISVLVLGLTAGLDKTSNEYRRDDFSPYQVWLRKNVNFIFVILFIRVHPILFHVHLFEQKCNLFSA